MRLFKLTLQKKDWVPTNYTSWDSPPQWEEKHVNFDHVLYMDPIMETTFPSCTNITFINGEERIVLGTIEDIIKAQFTAQEQ